MRAITLWQPWASLIALNLKRFETRSWGTKYRGPLMIHAAKRRLFEHEWQTVEEAIPVWCSASVRMHAENTLGCVVAIGRLVNCLEIGEELIEAVPNQEHSFGLWEQGRFAWAIDLVKPLTLPIPAVGAQRLWIPSDELIAAVDGRSDSG